MHVFYPLVKQPDPLLIPRPVLAFAVLEEPVDGEVAAAHEVRLAVQGGLPRRGVEPELAHAEARTEDI